MVIFKKQRDALNSDFSRTVYSIGFLGVVSWLVYIQETMGTSLASILHFEEVFVALRDTILPLAPKIVIFNFIMSSVRLLAVILLQRTLLISCLITLKSLQQRQNRHQILFFCSPIFRLMNCCPSSLQGKPIRFLWDGRQYYEFGYFYIFDVFQSIEVIHLLMLKIPHFWPIMSFCCNPSSF